MKVNKLLKHRIVWEAAYLGRDISEFIWDCIDKIPGIGNNLIQDFYPFPEKGKQARFKWHEPITHPIQFYEYSFTLNNFNHWVRFRLRHRIHQIQELILGKRLTDWLNWFRYKNDGKSLESTGFSGYFRNRERDTKYYFVRCLPFNYLSITEKRWVVEGEEDGTNLYMQSILAISGGEEVPELKEEKRILFKGFIFRKRDLFKAARAFAKAYYGTRWLHCCTKEYRDFHKELNAEFAEYAENDAKQTAELISAQKGE